MRGLFGEQNISKSTKAKADDMSATEFHQLRKQKICMIRAAMEALLHGAEKVSTTKRRQFQVRLNWVRQAVSTLSDAYPEQAKAWLECDIHQVTQVKQKLFDGLFQHHERQLVQDVGTEATSPRSRFAKELARRKAAAKDEAYGVAHMTTNKPLQFLICLSDAEKEATTCGLAHTESFTNQLKREIYAITSNEQKRFKKECSIRLIEFEAWWETFGIQALWRIIEQCVIHFGCAKMHLMSHISESIWWMGSGDNSTTDIS